MKTERLLSYSAIFTSAFAALIGFMNFYGEFERRLTPATLIFLVLVVLSILFSYRLSKTKENLKNAEAEYGISPESSGGKQRIDELNMQCKRQRIPVFLSMGLGGAFIAFQFVNWMLPHGPARQDTRIKCVVTDLRDDWEFEDQLLLGLGIAFDRHPDLGSFSIDTCAERFHEPSLDEEALAKIREHTSIDTGIVLLGNWKVGMNQCYVAPVGLKRIPDSLDLKDLGYYSLMDPAITDISPSKFDIVSRFLVALVAYLDNKDDIAKPEFILVKTALGKDSTHCQSDIWWAAILHLSNLVAKSDPARAIMLLRELDGCGSSPLYEDDLKVANYNEVLLLGSFQKSTGRMFDSTGKRISELPYLEQSPKSVVDFLLKESNQSNLKDATAKAIRRMESMVNEDQASGLFMVMFDLAEVHFVANGFKIDDKCMNWMQLAFEAYGHFNMIWPFGEVSEESFRNPDAYLRRLHADATDRVTKIERAICYFYLYMYAGRGAFDHELASGFARGQFDGDHFRKGDISYLKESSREFGDLISEKTLSDQEKARAKFSLAALAYHENQNDNGKVVGLLNDAEKLEKWDKDTYKGFRSFFLWSSGNPESKVEANHLLGELTQDAKGKLASEYGIFMR